MILASRSPTLLCKPATSLFPYLIDLSGQVAPVEVDLEVVSRHQEDRLPVVPGQNPT